MLHGWSSAKTSAYDQRYYRRWMHELPPLKHNSRQTVLDVHHAILPTTARLKPDSRKLLAAATPIAGRPDLAVLSPVDMVLHSAAHLFCNEDVGNSLRDLVDLDCLLRVLRTALCRARACDADPARSGPSRGDRASAFGVAAADGRSLPAQLPAGSGPPCLDRPALALCPGALAANAAAAAGDPPHGQGIPARGGNRRLMSVRVARSAPFAAGDSPYPRRTLDHPKTKPPVVATGGLEQ
jgi:hypothetical protein